MLRVVVFVLMWCSLCRCAAPVAEPSYIVRGDAPGALGFVAVADRWLLVHCSTEQQLFNYQYDAEQHEHGHEDEDMFCHAPLPRLFTTAELAAAQQRLAADLHRGIGDQVGRVSFSVAFAALSLLVSRAVVADIKKVIPLTLGIGFVLYHAHHKVMSIVALQKEKVTALAELRDHNARHYSEASLPSVEGVLVQYLNN